MKRFATLLLIVFFAAPTLGHPPILPQYQDVVTITPIPGGGGGAYCFWRNTSRVYADGTTEVITIERVCIP